MSDDSIDNVFKVMNQGFSFDVDVSQLPCGLNGALYFSEPMVCPRGLKFIAGRVG
ncbi:glycoside hydrolase family 7 protein [Tulasnella calospora MUT 4182]|uniref:Glucanase n=1 Tax=Tulasnella calospora MUT 4182 TaxID=1051891 RepID=A0A0C3Q2S9_9AGAM|nr:glycoside hydrolase family 7 protein [Tulasnella calospora MUT 4182]